MDFRTQLDGFSSFWNPTWWILEPIRPLALWRAVGAALDILKIYKLYKYLSAFGQRPRALRHKDSSRIIQVGTQNPPSWVPKSIKLGSKIHQVGVKNQEKSVLGGLWRALGAILAPRAAQDQNIPPNLISGGPFWHLFWRPKISQNQFFRVPRGVNFVVNLLIGPRSIF